MFGFNGQIPGPLISVGQRSTIFVNFTNDTPFPTTVHWHGVRLDNRYDGVPGVTQDLVQPGETFRYQIYFRDAGIYWYHPHHREDVQQELGLAGNMLVEPLVGDYYGPSEPGRGRHARRHSSDRERRRHRERSCPVWKRISQLHAQWAASATSSSRMASPSTAWRSTRARSCASSSPTSRIPERSTSPSARQPTASAPPLPIKVDRHQTSGSSNERPWSRASSWLRQSATWWKSSSSELGAYALTNHVQGINHRTGSVFLEEAAHAWERWPYPGVRTAEDHTHAFETVRTNSKTSSGISTVTAPSSIDHRITSSRSRSRSTAFPWLSSSR